MNLLRRCFRIWIVASLNLLALPVFAVTPMEYFNDLVAGGNDADFSDGKFVNARFNRPSGLAFDDSGDMLFVADRFNNRVRIVYLNDENRVETLAGTGQAGDTDGPFDKASFNTPTKLVYLPGERLAVYDAGSSSLRLLDLNAKTVSHLAVSSPEGQSVQLWDMVYSPSNDSIFYSETNKGRLQKLDLKTGTITTVISKNSQLPFPKAVCMYRNKLCVADQDLPDVFVVEGLSDNSASHASVTLTNIAKGDHIVEMVESGEVLYAIQTAGVPLARLLPTYQPVTLGTPWGFLLEYANPHMDSLFNFTTNEPVGFASRSKEQNKLFISSPHLRKSSIVSVKDYEFGNHWTVSSVMNQEPGLPDFNYPPAKPLKTYRILVVGSSQVVYAGSAVTGVTSSNRTFSWDSFTYSSPRIASFSKQLEFYLNAQASLEDSSVHYEVLTLGHPGLTATNFAYYEVPPLVEKFGIDMVCVFETCVSNENFDIYYTNPITSEGIPAYMLDPEYVLKPFSDRVTSGRPSELYERCKKENLVREVSSKVSVFNTFSSLIGSGDDEIRGILLEMLGKPFGLLNKKLQTIKRADNEPLKFFVCFAPGNDNGGIKEKDYELFWKDLSAKNNISFLDLTEGFNALNMSFFPTGEPCCHYTAYGNTLISYLLSYSLIHQNWIPFKPSPMDKSAK